LVVTVSSIAERPRLAAIHRVEFIIYIFISSSNHFENRCNLDLSFLSDILRFLSSPYACALNMLPCLPPSLHKLLLIITQTAYSSAMGLAAKVRTSLNMEPLVHIIEGPRN